MVESPVRTAPGDPGRGVSPLLALAVAFAAAAPAGLAAQSCTPLPAERNQLWIGAGLEGGAAEGRWEVDAVFNMFDQLQVGVRSATGGYDTGDSDAVERGFELGPILRAGPLSLCPAVLGSLTSYDFLDRFGWQRGEVKQLKAGLRTSLAGHLFQGSTAAARWLAMVDIVDLRWKMAGRALEVTDSVRVLRDESRTHSTDVEAAVAAELRVGPVALSAGVASAILDRRRLLQFVRVSVRATG